MRKNGFSFLTIGKTQESTETQESYKRYVGIGSSFVKAVNPSKKELDAIMGYESANEPEYIKEAEEGKEAYIHFIVETDPEQCEGINIKTKLMFTLRQVPAYNRDKTKVQVIDQYGNYTWADAEDAKAGKPLPASAKIDQNKYRMACVGECDLVEFLKKFLVVPNSLQYTNSVWSLRDDAEDGKFALEHIKDYFNGDFSELKSALAMRPNNKIKLLYGVRTSEEGRQYQAVSSKGKLMLRNSSGNRDYIQLEKELKSLKDNGSYPNTEFKVQNLAEYTVEATNLESAAPASSSSDMPWD